MPAGMSEARNDHGVKFVHEARKLLLAEPRTGTPLRPDRPQTSSEPVATQVGHTGMSDTRPDHGVDSSSASSGGCLLDENRNWKPLGPEERERVLRFFQVLLRWDLAQSQEISTDTASQVVCGPQRRSTL
jgi:hypothetical protein